MDCYLCKTRILRSQIHFYCLRCCNHFCKKCKDPPLDNILFRYDNNKAGKLRRSTERTVADCRCGGVVGDKDGTVIIPEPIVPCEDVLGFSNTLSTLRQNSPDSLLFGSFNIRGLRNATKLTELREALSGNDALCVLLGETFLDPGIPDNVLCFPGRRVLRRDRANSPGNEKQGGGLLFVVAAIVEAKRCPELEYRMPQFEVIWLKMRIKKRYIPVCGVYRPPDMNARDTECLFDSISEAYNDPKYSGTELMVLGDLNLNYNISASTNVLCTF